MGYARKLQISLKETALLPLRGALRPTRVVVWLRSATTKFLSLRIRFVIEANCRSFRRKVL